jgi:hypothetical protein
MRACITTLHVLIISASTMNMFEGGRDGDGWALETLS